MNKLFIHQPEYLPWTHFFEKIKLSDVYVVLNDVQYNRRSFQNRNQIKTKDGQKWLSVPLKYAPREFKISKIMIDNSSNWQNEHINLIIENYKHSKYFESIFESIIKIYNNKYDYLSDFNIDLIRTLLKIMNIDCKIVFQSELEIDSKKSDLIFDICNKLNCNEYITGFGSKNYLDNIKFNRNNIKINYIKPNLKEYNQQFKEINFIGGLSVIDKLFNVGYNIL